MRRSRFSVEGLRKSLFGVHDVVSGVWALRCRVSGMGLGCRNGGIGCRVQAVGWEVGVLRSESGMQGLGLGVDD